MTLASGTVIRADEAVRDAMFESGRAGTGPKALATATGHWRAPRTRGVPAIRRFPDRDKNHTRSTAPGTARRSRDPDVLHHHRRPQVASERTFKTGKDALGWDQSQARNWHAINRHTALTALAQLRTPGAGRPPEPQLRLRARRPAARLRAGRRRAAADGADLQFWTGTAPLPDSAASRPALIPRSSCRPPNRRHRPAGSRLASWPHRRARPAFHLRWSVLLLCYQARACWQDDALKMLSTCDADPTGGRAEGGDTKKASHLNES